MGVLSWKMKKFWDETCNDLWGKIDGKVGCAFSSREDGAVELRLPASRS